MDRLNRLVGTVYYGAGEAESTTFDRLGNREAHVNRQGETTQYTLANPANEYAAINGQAVQYDGTGNLCRDEDGRGYAYDEQNRLVRVFEDTNGNGVHDAGETVLANYAYDAFGRRVEFENLGAGTTTRYYHAGVSVIQERDAADNLVRSHVHGTQYLDERVTTFEATGLRAGQTSYYLLGGNFSVVGVGSADGSAVTRLEYSPAGERIGPGEGAGSYAHDADADGDVDLDDFVAYASCLAASAGPGAPGLAAVCLAFHDANAGKRADGDVDLEDFAGLQYCFSGAGQTPPPECFRPAPAGVPPGSGSFALHGGMVDVLTSGRSGPDGALSLQYSRARYFDLTHGRFLQRDPKGYIDGGNLYEAFGSNPARFSDPMGMQYEDDGLLAAIRRYLTGDGWMEQVSDRMGMTAAPNPGRRLVYEQVDERLIHPLAETAREAEPVIVRVAGGMRAAEGASEVTVGVIIIVKTGGIAGVAGGGALTLHGFDSLQAGTRQVIWGEVTPTETYSVIADAGYPTLAFAVDTVPSVVAAVGAPALALERASAAPALTVSHVVGESTRPVSLSSRVLAAAERSYQRVVVVVFDAEPGDVILGSGLSPGRISATQREEQLLFSFMKPAPQASGSGNIVVSRGGHVLDLAGNTWRQAAFEDGGLVYLLRDANTEQILKVGQTTPQTFTGRFKAYVSASEKTGRVLEVEVFEVPAELRGLIEGQFRQHLGATPGSLPWDNTGGRLGRTGQGIPPGRVPMEWHVE